MVHRRESRVPASVNVLYMSESVGRKFVLNARCAYATAVALLTASALMAGCSKNETTGSGTSSTAAGDTGSHSAASAPATADSGAPGEPGAPAESGPSGEGGGSTKIATPGGEFVVQGAILQKYNAFGGSKSPLGLPTSNEEPAPGGGRYNTFDGGAIYWSPQTGAHVIWGGIRDSWEHDGGAAGPLGYPTSDEITIPGGWQSDFQHGNITYTDGPHISLRH